MKKNQKLLIVGNWKMNPAILADAKNIFQSIKKAASVHPSLSVVVCPPFPFISALAAASGKSSAKSGKGVSVGAQDISLFDDGMSRTGEVGAYMAESAGASYVIVGHSERRALGDTGQVVSKKVQQALKTGMSVIVCFGEKERDTDGGYLEVIKAQLREAVAGVNKNQFQKIVLAYEPVWAIGRTDNVALTSYDLHQMVVFIRKTLRELFGDTISSMVPILYGGSVTPENAEDIIYNGEVDGLLVGRASWKSDSFKAIFDAINGGNKAHTKRALTETLLKAKNTKHQRYNRQHQPKVSLKQKQKKQKKSAAKTFKKTKHAKSKKAKRPLKKRSKR